MTTNDPEDDEIEDDDEIDYEEDLRVVALEQAVSYLSSVDNVYQSEDPVDLARRFLDFLEGG